jgi:hypothetical protein
MLDIKNKKIFKKKQLLLHDKKMKLRRNLRIPEVRMSTFP